VGRERECAVRVDSADLSRRHARIVVTRAETTIEDLGSKNGTQVNGERITRCVPLKDSDRIQVGSLTLTYRMAGPLPSTLTRQRL
jgi:pSer/pThr/pTyr-binding forkhead associated (FHA) protein